MRKIDYIVDVVLFIHLHIQTPSNIQAVSVLCYRAKDVRNKEFFEKHFPEIKRHTLRLGPKGFSVVRSEAELNEILDELYEQEEVV